MAWITNYVAISRLKHSSDTKYIGSCFGRKGREGKGRAGWRKARGGSLPPQTRCDNQLTFPYCTAQQRLEDDHPPFPLPRVTTDETYYLCTVARPSCLTLYFC
jgi:hypothetical protein